MLLPGMNPGMDTVTGFPAALPGCGVNAHVVDGNAGMAWKSSIATCDAGRPRASVHPSGPDPKAKIDIESFIAENARWLNDEADAMLRATSLDEIRSISDQGSMKDCRDPVATVRARLRSCQEGAASEETRAPKPATEEEFEAFKQENKPYLNEDAEEALRAMGGADRKRVMNAGTLNGCRNPAAVVRRRVREAKEQEREEHANLIAAADSLWKVEDPDLKLFQDEVRGSEFSLLPATAVPETESRFAKAEQARWQVDDPTPVDAAGCVEGIGGIVEIMGKKYGCAKGERLRCVGERGGLWQFENGKSAPKIHEGTGWRWVVDGEREDGAADSGSGNQKTAEEYFAFGEERANAGDIDAAEECFRAAVRLDPEYSDVRFCLGHLLAKKGDLEGAEDELRAALDLDPNDSECCFALAIVLGQRGDKDGAEVYYEAAVRCDAGHADAHFRLNEVFVEKGDLPAALEQLRAIIRIDDNRLDAHYELAKLLRRQGDVAGAEAAYKDVIRFDPTSVSSASALFELGRLAEEKSDVTGAAERAEEMYRTAAERDPMNAETRFRLAGLLAVRGDLVGAEKNYRAVVQLDPRDGNALYALGIVLRLRGDLTAAADTFEAAVQLCPNNPDVRVSQGLLKRNRRDIPGAEKCFAAALQMNPAHALAKKQLADLKAGTPAEAENQAGNGPAKSGKNNAKPANVGSENLPTKSVSSAARVQSDAKSRKKARKEQDDDDSSCEVSSRSCSRYSRRSGRSSSRSRQSSESGSNQRSSSSSSNSRSSSGSSSKRCRSEENCSSSESARKPKKQKR